MLDWVCEVMQARGARRLGRIQRLWGGYGELVRVALEIEQQRRQAREVLSTQRDNNPMGPLKKLNVVQGQALLLGEALTAVSAIHLAEERAGVPYLGRRTAVRVNAAGMQSNSAPQRDCSR